GLIEWDVPTRKARHYGVAHGLLMPDVSTMYLTIDRLWLGFAERMDFGMPYASGIPPYRSWLGGLSDLDLKTGRFTGYTPELRANLASVLPGGAANRASTASAGLERTPVEFLIPCTADSIWVANRTSGIRHLNFVTRTWDPLQAGDPLLFTVASI